MQQIKLNLIFIVIMCNSMYVINTDGNIQCCQQKFGKLPKTKTFYIDYVMIFYAVMRSF